MSDDAHEATVICPCGSRMFFAVPDGGGQFLVECAACGQRGELASADGATLTLPGGVTVRLIELPDDAEEP